jgi:hypothetical protein
VEATLVGRVELRGGAPQAAAFARWLLAARPEGPYETEFLLVDRELGAAPAIAWLPAGALEPVRIEHTTLTVEVLLGREAAGGPEYLIVEPMGFAPEQGFAFQVCEPLDCEPLDRARLEREAAALLAAAS